MTIMEKKTSNPCFSVSVGKSKKYLNVVASAINTSADADSGESPLSVVSVDASLPVRAILAELPIHELRDEALVAVLKYVTKRDAITDYSVYKGALVNAMVRSKYSEDEVEAIVCNVLAAEVTEEHKNEWLAFQAYREECKARAKAIIDIMSE
jgi:hypothetical protein